MKRCLYMFQMNDSKVYLGISHDLKERISSHMCKGETNRSLVRREILKGNEVKRIYKLSEYINEVDACEYEQALIFLFREYLGKDNVLNVKKGGQL